MTGRGWICPSKTPPPPSVEWVIAVGNTHLFARAPEIHDAHLQSADSVRLHPGAFLWYMPLPPLPGSSPPRPPLPPLPSADLDSAWLAYTQTDDYAERGSLRGAFQQGWERRRCIDDKWLDEFAAAVSELCAQVEALAAEQEDTP